MGLDRPKYLDYDYHYFDDKEKIWKIKESAPDWIKKEFYEFMEKVNPKPDESGLIIQY